MVAAREGVVVEVIQICQGSLFDSECQTLVNPVNRVGVSGAGLAKEFKRRFPEMHREYAKACNQRRFGRVFHWRRPNADVLCLATKEHWRDPSELEFVGTSLEQFLDALPGLGIKSIAFPALGCGNGGLEWSAVRPIMTHHLSQWFGRVEIYEPMAPARRVRK